MEQDEKEKEKRVTPTASAILGDGTLVEMVYRPELRRTAFALFSAGRWTFQDDVAVAEDARLVPFSPENNLIKNGVVLLPSLVNWRRFLPSRSTVKTWLRPARVDMNARCRPFGDHDGFSSNPGMLVSRVTPVPSKFMT